jgi:hypothetical protein
LENKAWERVKSKDASVGERAASWLVTNVMKVKRKTGSGVPRSRCAGMKNKRSRAAGKGLRKSKRTNTSKSKKHRPTASFKTDVVKKVMKALYKSPTVDLNDASSKALKKSSLVALRAAKIAIKNAGGRRNVRIPRIIPFEAKSGGILPLIPIFAALGALGSLAGGASAIAKTAIDAKNARKKLEEDRRHNAAMEALGKGIFVRKTKRGYGLFLRKQKN